MLFRLYVTEISEAFYLSNIITNNKTQAVSKKVRLSYL